MSVIGNAITVGGSGGGGSLPTVYVDNMQTTSTDFFEKTYTISGNGVAIAFGSTFSDQTDGYGTWISEIYHNDNLIMAAGSRLNSPDKTTRSFGMPVSAPITVSNGDTVKIRMQNTKTGTITFYRRLMCFGCTAS